MIKVGRSGLTNALAKGDVVLVDAVNHTYQYQVTSSKVVPENFVAVLAPTRDDRLTLITCEGTFYPATRDYSDRRVVVATLVDR